MEREKDTKLTIIEVMSRAEGPMILNHIAKEAGFSPQLVDYHLRAMIKEGIIQEVDTHYMLQPIFYDETLYDGLCSGLLPLMEAMMDEIDTSQFNEEEKSVIVFRVFKVVLERFLIDVQNTFEKSI